MSFEQAIRHFQATTAAELEASIRSGRKVIAFIGRSTCPYCQRFAPKLASVQAETGATIYFVDSSNPADETLNNLWSKYGVVTVPGLLVAEDKEVKVVCDSSISEEEITAFIG
jgi:predicted bacteriocin transport accessory protein